MLDFFEAVPPGGDVYLLQFILHDWDDVHALTILRNCRHAMGPQSRLLPIETLVVFQMWICVF
jgi:O-methyltransferase